MATEGKNLSNIESITLSKPDKIKIGIVVSSWNTKITESLKEGAINALTSSGIKKNNI